MAVGSTRLHMTFSPRRKSTAASTNPFGRKLSPEAAGARDAPRSVQQSLFSTIRNAGYEGSAASSIAWKLIKAVRPSMSEHRLSLSQLGSCPHEELTELRTCAVACSERESMAAESSRAELVGDIVAMLDGMIARSPAPPSLQPISFPVGAAPAARRAAPAVDDSDAAWERRMARIAELKAEGGRTDEQIATIICVEHS